ncbi:serine-rich adhesin for platelets-like [Biomphalaria glabrata]|uniref:Serine-rich adhesin for platelets-like n=1 Tax=Biomphalaria glabrata TaxID=6526 RepID=A0A9U8EDY8_BIOGL|nr:serine-rich adhesin for platelets-like [Biomphalaria glabrata]
MLQARYLLPEHVPVLMSLLALYLCEGYLTTDQDSITVLIDTDNCTQLFECVNLTSCEVHLEINNYSLTVLETKGNNSVEFNDSDSSLCLSSTNVKGQFGTCAKVNATVEPSTTRCSSLDPFLNGSISYLLFTIEFENSTCRLVNSRRTNCDINKTVHSVEESASLEQTILPTSIESSKSLTFVTSSSESATAMDVLNESYVTTTSQSSLDVTVVDSTFSADHLQSFSITDFVLESTQSLTTTSTLSASSPSSVADSVLSVLWISETLHTVDVIDLTNSISHENFFTLTDSVLDSPTTSTLSASSTSSVADTVLSGLWISGTLHTVDVIDLTNSISHDHFLTLTDSVLEPTSVMNEILTTVSLESKISHDSSISFIESQSVQVSPSSSVVESLQMNSLTFSIESTHTLDESITSTLTDFSVDDLSSFLEVTPSKEVQFLETTTFLRSISNEIISSFRDETSSLSTSFDLPVFSSASYSMTVYKVTQTESPLFSSSLYSMEHLSTATNPETVQASATIISVKSSWDTNESTDQITQTTEAITPSLMTNTFNNINISIESTHVLNGSITSPLTTGFSVDDLSNEFQFLTTKSLTASIPNEIISSFRDETTSLSTSFDLPESSSASYSSTVYKVTQTEYPLFGSSSLYPMAHLPTATNPETVQASATMISVKSLWDTNESTDQITQTTEAITPSLMTNTFNNINISIESTHVLNGSITSPLTGFSVDDLSNEFQFLTTKSLTASIPNEIISSFRDETTSLSTSFNLPVFSSASYSMTVYKETQTESPLFSSSVYPMAHLTTASNPETVQASATMIFVNSAWDTNKSTDQITQTTEAITPSSMTNTFNNINIVVSTSTETVNSRIDTSIVVSIRDPSMLSMAVHPLATLTTSESLAPSEFTASVEASSNVFVFSSFTSKSSHQSMTLVGVSSTDTTSEQNNITTLDNVTSHQKVILTTVSTNDTVFYTMTTLDPNVTVNLSVFASTLRHSDDTVPIVLGVVLGSAALSVLGILLCLYVKHRKRSQLATRAQRYKTNGFRNWKSTKRNTSGSDQTSFDHIPLADYSPMHSKEYVGNHTKSNVDSSGTNIDKDNNPLFDNDTLQTQEDGLTKAADFGRLRADVIIAGLNNNIQGKIKPRKSDALNLENIQLNDLRTQRDNTKSDSNVNPLLVEKNEIKLKATAHGKSRKSREYTDIATEVFDKENTRPRPTSCDVYATISEVDTGSIRYQYISLYDKARAPETEVANPELFEYYSTIATESNQRKITSNKAINQRNSELSTDRTSFNGSSLYEDINIFETKEVDSSQAGGNQDMYSILGQESRERLNPYNSLPYQKEEGMNSDSEYPQHAKQVSQNTSGQVQPVYNKLFTTDVLQTDGHIYNQKQQESPSLANKSRSENVLPSSNESQNRNSDLRENGEIIYFILEPGSQYD